MRMLVPAPAGRQQEITWKHGTRRAIDNGHRAPVALDDEAKRIQPVAVWPRDFAGHQHLQIHHHVEAGANARRVPIGGIFQNQNTALGILHIGLLHRNIE